MVEIRTVMQSSTEVSFARPEYFLILFGCPTWVQFHCCSTGVIHQKQGTATWDWKGQAASAFWKRCKSTSWNGSQEISRDGERGVGDFVTWVCQISRNSRTRLALWFFRRYNCFFCFTPASCTPVGISDFLFEPLACLIFCLRHSRHCTTSGFVCNLLVFAVVCNIFALWIVLQNVQDTLPNATQEL